MENMFDPEISYEKVREFFKRPGVKEVDMTMANLVLGKSYDSYNYVFDESLQPYTDGKKVVVSILRTLANPKFEKFWGPISKVMMCHEVHHILYSNFMYIESIGEFYGEMMKKAGYNSSFGASLARNMLNILEDERIDDIAVSEFPGMRTSYLLVNESIRKANAIEDTEITPQKELNDFLANILCYAKSGFTAPGVEIYSGTEFEKVFFDIAPLIDSVVASSGSEAYDLCKDILTEIFPYITGLMDKDNFLSQSYYPEYQGTSGSKKNPSNGSSGLRGNQSQDSEDEESQTESGSADSTDGENKSSDGEAGRSSTEQGSKSKSFGSLSSGDGDFSDSLTDDDIKSLCDAFEKAAKNSEAQADSFQKKSLTPNVSSQELSKMMSECYGPAGKVSGFKETFNSKFDKRLPAEDMAEARKLKREFLKLKEDISDPIYDRTSGKLDMDVLHRVYADRGDIFMQDGDPESVDCVFDILIDFSGSMSSASENGKAKYQNAIHAAAIIEEALKGVFPAKISVFYTDIGAEQVCIKNFDTKTTGNACMSSGLCARGGNRDSVHINYAVEELKKRKESRKILLILSDGTPSAYSSFSDGIHEVSQAVSRARKNRVEVVSLFFGTENFRKQNMKSYKEMYGKNIISTSPGEIPTELPKVLKKIIAF